jgi:hypothetical protein
VRLARGAGAEVGEDLVDHGRLRDAGDEAHRTVAERTGQRIDLDDLLEERRRRAFAHRRVASVGASGVVSSPCVQIVNRLA